MAKLTVKTKNAGEVTLPEGVGKRVKITQAAAKHGLKEDQEVTAMRRDELVDFEVSYPENHKKVKHVPEGEVIKVHALDAAIMEKMGKGKIVKVHPVAERK